MPPAVCDHPVLGLLVGQEFDLSNLEATDALKASNYCPSSQMSTHVTLGGTPTYENTISGSPREFDDTRVCDES